MNVWEKTMDAKNFKIYLLILNALIFIKF